MYKEYDPKILREKRLEADNCKETLSNLFTNHPNEFKIELWEKDLGLFKLSVESFDFFFPRGNFARAEKEIEQALEVFAKILK